MRDNTILFQIGALCVEAKEVGILLEMDSRISFALSEGIMSTKKAKTKSWWILRQSSLKPKWYSGGISREWNCRTTFYHEMLCEITFVSNQFHGVFDR